MAVIGKARAVAQIGRWKVGGFLAWLMWGGIHILFLVGFRNQLQVLLAWFWNWLLNTRDARLITGDAGLHIQTGGRRTRPRSDALTSPRTHMTEAAVLTGIQSCRSACARTNTHLHSSRFPAVVTGS
jgi:hypothetical protein